MIKWNYVSNTLSSTGYESVIDKLKMYKKEDYVKLNKEDKNKIIEEVFNIYRSINIYPIYYYNQEGIDKEINKCINKSVKIENQVLNLKFNQGQSLCRFLFPNLNTVNVKGATNNSMMERFYNDHKLKRAIDFCLRFKKSVTPSEIRTALEMIGGGVATNFKAMNAKALYEKYCPKGGIIYDFACGFGGRMLGALTSKNNYTYIGVEPCIETYTHLNELGLHIERNTKRKNSFKLYCMGSEDFNTLENCIDFAFSSPPYFNLEQYSEELTQCYNKFPNINDWIEGYVKPTIKNTYKMLKVNSYYAVNIADFNIGKNKFEYVDKWIELAKSYGFTFIEVLPMKLQTRRGNGHKKDGVDMVKKEGIFIFKK